MEKQFIKALLYIEDNPGDARLVMEMLKGTEFVIEHFERLNPALERLGQGEIDLVLCDLKLPDSSELDTFLRVRKIAPQMPIVVITGTFEQEEQAIEALERGAQDYLIKDEINTRVLVRTLRYASERKQIGDKLQEALKIKMDFTANVSHELRTPLTAIKECLELISDGSVGTINAQQKKFLDISERNVGRLARLIDDVLDFEKMQSGKTTYNLQENDVNEVIEEAFETMVFSAKEKGLDLILKLNKDLPKIEFDWDKVTQVLTNLLNNAIKFTDEGSITITSNRAGNNIQVAVQDTGYGIAEEDMAKLFKQFEQLETRIGGTGLGLAICKEIVEAHKGRIWAESVIAKGSVFYFTLPIEKSKD